ncbi:hypothetical protein MMC10_000591 [Thelotrema lepadinum]|nr:hypothetical protein [Thelotrema lepadinum]
MYVHGLAGWTKCDLDCNPTTPIVDAAIGEEDRLTALPQELYEEICQYLGPADLISLKLCSWTLLGCTRASFEKLKEQAEDSLFEGGECFRAVTYLENTKGERLQCALCGKSHKRNAFVKSMADQPGASRYCRNYQHCVLEFGRSGLTWDELHEHIAAMEGDHRTSSNRAIEKTAELYPGRAVRPNVEFPFDHAIHSFESSVWSYPAFSSGEHLKLIHEFTGRVRATQSLRFKGSHIILTSKIVVGSEQCRTTYEACAALDPNPNASSVRFWFFDGFYVCPDGYFEDSQLSKILRGLCAAATEHRVERYRSTCAFCQALAIISSDIDGCLTIQTEKDLGPCKDEQDPLWLRHVSQRMYSKRMINRLLKYAKKVGEEAWNNMNEVPVNEVPEVVTRSSRRLRGIRSLRAAGGQDNSSSRQIGWCWNQLEVEYEDDCEWEPGRNSRG